MIDENPYIYWQQALQTGRMIDSGDRLDGTFVRAGFFKRNEPADARLVEAVAFWRDSTGNLICKRTIHGNGANMDIDAIEALYAEVCCYPIPYHIWLDAQDPSFVWPPEYRTRLSLAEIKDNVGWTPQLGRRKLGADAQPAENPRATIGDNNPPAELTAELTAEKALAQDIDNLAAGCSTWLQSVGGAPRSKAEADVLADYATKFGGYKTDAETNHKNEKARVLEQGRAIDTKWFALRDKAKKLRERCLDIVHSWIQAEDARRAEEACKVNEAARQLAESVARKTDSPVETPPEIIPEKIRVGSMRTVSQRSRTVWRVTDAAAFAAHLAAMPTPPADFITVLETIARRMGASGIQNLPGVEKSTETSAA